MSRNPIKYQKRSNTTPGRTSDEGMLEAITHFAIGGMAALEGRDDELAGLLLEQMNAASRNAQGTPDG